LKISSYTPSGALDMYLKGFLKLRGTLAYRLTLWYAGILTISCIVIFLAFIFLVSSIIQDRTDQELLIEAKEYSGILASSGIDGAKAEIINESRILDLDVFFFRLINNDGEEIASTDMSSWKNIVVNRKALKKLSEGSDHVLETMALPDRQYKVRVVYAKIGPGTILHMGQTLEENDQLLIIFRNTLGIILVVLIFSAPLTGWFMARRALAGIEEVTRTAMEISKGDFERRVPVKESGDEVERLATTFNSMLDRIHALISGMREMTDNIAHDLRSPITRIRGLAEMTLATGKTMDEYEFMTSNTIEECDRLLGMINTMLDITEAESGTGEFKKVAVDITDVIRNAIELFLPIAEDKGITINFAVSASHYVSGDIQKLQRMVANLLDNALKFTPPGGIVAVEVSEGEGQVDMTFLDTGIGIAEEDLPHIFKRFYRCDKSHREVGTGLGLSLARAIAITHGGGITVKSRLGEGSVFSVILPKAPTSL
jgi:heavy metal sensor kinase